MIPIAVVGHPRREKLTNKLAAEVQADVICWDTSHLGPAKNHLQAWRWLAEDYDAEWGVVLEDDVIPCRHFRRNLEEALRHSPTNILSLYLGRGRPPHRQPDISAAISYPVSYYTDSDLLSAQGYAIRTELFHCHDQVLPWARRYPIDEAISHWANLSGNLIGYCRQSLVDHIDGTTLIADHGDGQGRNGKTALWTPDCDPQGKDLPEIRKAWLLARTDTSWTQGVRPLPTEGKKHGIRRTSKRSRRHQGTSESPTGVGAQGPR